LTDSITVRNIIKSQSYSIHKRFSFLDKPGIGLYQSPTYIDRSGLESFLLIETGLYYHEEDLKSGSLKLSNEPGLPNS